MQSWACGNFLTLRQDTMRKKPTVLRLLWQAKELNCLTLRVFKDFDVKPSDNATGDSCVALKWSQNVATVVANAQLCLLMHGYGAHTVHTLAGQPLCSYARCWWAKLISRVDKQSQFYYIDSLKTEPDCGSESTSSAPSVFHLPN